MKRSIGDFQNTFHKHLFINKPIVHNLGGILIMKSMEGGLPQNG